jgi:hypothetical protein
VLEAANAIAADEAIRRVAAAVAAAQKAVDGRWSLIVAMTGSESAASAQDNALAETKRVLVQLQAERPALDNAHAPGFLDLAATAADVSDLVQSAGLTSPAGFEANVVAPTVASVVSGVKAAATGALIGLPIVLVLGIALGLWWWLPRRRP